MSYESAPATILIATHCAICARPLVDADSVERGVGPDCADKYGYGDAQGSVDAEALLRALGASLTDPLLPNLPESAVQPWLDGDAHKVANILTRLIAVEQTGPQVRRFIAAIAALGYATLAARIGKRVNKGKEIRIEHEDDPTFGPGALIVRAPFNERFNDEFRRLHVANRWDRERKVRVVHPSGRKALWQALCASFPAGTIVNGVPIG